MPAHVCTDQCDQIKRLRGLRWPYRRITQRIGISLDLLRRLVRAHSRIFRDGAASCLTCRRLLDGRVPETKLLAADECCGWCGRRHDGDIRSVVTVLERLAQAEGPTQDVQRLLHDLRVWPSHRRRNSAEIRERPGGILDVSEEDHELPSDPQD